MTDPYYDNVVLLLPFDQDSPGPRGTLDYSPLKNVINWSEDAGLSAAQSKFGGTSAYFDGVGDYLLQSNNLLDGTGDFTCEGWLYITSYPVANVQQIISCTDDLTTGFNFEISIHGKLALYLYTTDYVYVEGGTLINLSTWNHFSLARSSGVFSVFLNGILQLSISRTTSIPALPLNFGRHPILGWYLSGFLDDLRITKGIARYTADFTPPGALRETVPYQPVSPRVRDIGQISRLLRPDQHAYFGGNGLITGVVKAVVTPVQRRVRLYETSTGNLIQEIWSAVDGTYSFPGMKKGIAYTLMAVDYTGTFDDVVIARVMAV